MQDLYHAVLPVRALAIQSISASPLDTGDVDLKGFEAAQVLVDFGDIDELGASPDPGAEIAIKLEHADDDGSGAAGAYAAVGAGDVIGPDAVSNGVVATTTTDAAPIRFGYVGGRRFIKVTLTPAALTTGGPVGIWVEKAHARHAPAG
jgi:hypothetical protein